MPWHDLDAPGHKVRRTKSGAAHYWVCRDDIRKQGYTPTLVRLHYNIDDPAERLLLAGACRRLQAEMLAWSKGFRPDPLAFDGTVAGLVRRYQVDEASPYRNLKWNTRRTVDHTLKIIERAFGKRALAALRIADFRRWYDEAKKPKNPGEPERVRKAHGIISMTRRIVGYGVTAELPECARLAAILDEARFKQPARRRVTLSLDHVRAFIEAALAAGRLSLALGTALQFETALRQRDVIGEWEPIPDGAAATGIVLNRRRWVNGLTWADLSPELVLYKVTTKTGADVTHDLRLAPLVLALMEKVPPDQRVGPMIIDETAGRPYAEFAYGRDWRTIAQAAGIPDHVRNMDARAGAISEADDAGADLDHIRSAAGHTLASTTARYVRGASGKSRKVAELRLAHRATRNGA